jgi:PAS domain S-box-containing protein
VLADDIVGRFPPNPSNHRERRAKYLDLVPAFPVHWPYGGRMRLYRDLIIISAGFSALLLGTLVLPLWVLLVLGCAFAGGLIVRRRLEHRRKMEAIHQRLINLRSEGLVIEEKVREAEDDVFYRMIMTLLGDLERSLFKLVEKNIQLLSLKEIGRTIISSLDEQRLTDSVFEYLNRGVGYKEAAFIILRKKKRSFQAIVTIERASRMVRRALNFGFADLASPVYDAFLAGKPFLIKDAAMHPLLTIGGEELFPGSTMTSYLCVPLLKSSEANLCFESEDCLLRKPGHSHVEPSSDTPYLRSDECLSCPAIPLLGALIVTDGYRGTPLTNIDQVTLETVGSLVSSNMENWYLYQELRQEEIFRERVIEGMLNGVFVTDREGNVTLANRAARDMCQYKQRQIRALRIDDMIIGEPGGGAKKSPVFQLFENNVPLTHYDCHLRRKDGMHVPIRMNASALSAEDGEVQGAIIEFIDMSEITRMEEEIRYLDRLAVLGRFTSAIAHEIRNPLTGIAAGIQYINRSQSLSPEHRENIAFVLNEVDRLNRIITDLFKVAKPHDLLCQKVSVRNLIDRSYRPLEEIFRNKAVAFGLSVEDNIPLIEVDPDQIVQVLINILKNAAEAVGQGGTVSVAARLYEGGDPDVVREKLRDMVCIEIADNGAGIVHDEKERIFEPFFSRKKGGTGLGLFVSQSIIQHHHGRISVSSDVGKGTSFRLYLPIARPRKGGSV